MTILGAVTAGRGMGVLGLACIFSTLVAVDGPLLQKATHVAHEQMENKQVSLNVSVLPELPKSLFSGYLPGNMTGIPGYLAAYQFNETIPTGDNGTAPNNLFTVLTGWLYQIQGPWFRDETLSGGIRGCPSDVDCQLTVRAPALDVTACTSHTLPVDYWEPAAFPLSHDSYISKKNPAAPLNRNAFMVDISLVVDEEKEVINLITGYAHTKDCKGTLHYTACTLEAVSP